MKNSSRRIEWTILLLAVSFFLLSPRGLLAQESGSKGGLFNREPSSVETVYTDAEISKISRFRDMALDEKIRSFNQLSDSEKTAVFKSLSSREQEILLGQVDEKTRLALFHSLDLMQQTRLFEQLTEDERNSLLEGMEPEEQQAWAQRGPKFTPLPEQTARKGVRREPESTAIEHILSGRFPTDITRELKQFGYDYFEKNGSSFAPVGHVPVSENYIIGPGDSFTVHLWGRTEATHEVTVTREGTVTLPRVGTLNVGGLRFSELKPYLLHKFRELYPDFEMSVSMGALRTIDVFIMGEAAHPGTYSVSALSTVVTALFQAGGPNKIGSLRDIRVMRQGDRVGSLDLYEFFIKGSRAHDMRLQPGDTIFVPVVGPVVGVVGCVRRPAIYELKGMQNLGDVISLAGGLLPVGHLQNIVVERVVGHDRRVVRSFSMNPKDLGASESFTMPLQDGDVVKIYPVHEQLQQVVYLQGHVKYPREYEFTPGMRLGDLIPSYDILLPEAYLEQAEIARLVPPDLHSEIITFDLKAFLEGDSTQNLALQERDRVIIYGKWDKKDIPEVHVKGAVREPGTYRLYPGMTVRDLVFQAGNLTTRAYKEKATLRRVVTLAGAPAETTKIDFSLQQALSAEERENLLLQQDDIVYVREIPEYQEALNRVVTLEGEFVFPGEYTFSRGERLADVIMRAGGLTQEAYLQSAVFQRKSVQRIQREQLKDYINTLEKDVLSMGAMSAEGSINEDQAAILKQTLAAKQELLKKLRQTEPTGRMVVDLEEAVNITSSPHNLEMRPGDHLAVQKRPDTVVVMGEVYNPTALFVEPERTVGYYLDRVGGVTKNAEEDEIYVVRADGTVVSKNQKGYFGMASWDGSKHRWTMGGFDSIEIYPGDTIIVPRKVEKYPWLRVAKDVTQVIYQIALAAGVWLTHF